jgi:hypothetical protein
MVRSLSQESCIILTNPADDIDPDYQFDIYRMMRYHNSDNWTPFRPLSNVMVSSKCDAAEDVSEHIWTVASLSLTQAPQTQGSTQTILGGSS